MVVEPNLLNLIELRPSVNFNSVCLIFIQIQVLLPTLDQLEIDVQMHLIVEFNHRNGSTLTFKLDSERTAIGVK